MIRSSGDIQVKRPRGRPKGSAPFAERDRAALAQFADHYLKSPGMKLAPFLKSLGYEDKGVRRAQNRWGADKQSYLDQARERIDGTGADQLLDMLAAYTEASNACRNASRHSQLTFSVTFGGSTRQRSDAPEGASITLKFCKQADTTAEELAAFLREADAVNDKIGQGDRNLADLARSDVSLAHKLYAASVKLLEASIHLAGHDHQSRQSDQGVQSKSEEDI